MIQRAECLCDGKIIGIESIYTVIDGKQINIKGKIEALRKRSRNKELFCPCGCGTNLILVAGEKQLREQHFRIDDDNYNSACEYVSEGKVSVQSKIVLKCWLDDKLDSAEIETRVPIYAIDDIDRKFEFSLIDRENGVAISYHYERASLSDEKLEILESNSKGLQILYVIDKKNSFDNGQYQERLMKVQERQGYCILLDVASLDYTVAKMKGVFYAQQANGLWKEVCFVEGFLKDFCFRSNNELLFENKSVKDLLKDAKVKFYKEVELEKLKIEEEKRLLAEELEREKLREEAKRIEEENYKLQLKSVSEKFPQNNKFIDNSSMLIAIPKEIKTFDFSRQDIMVKNHFGKRLYKCKFCGKIGVSDVFSICGGIGEINEGVCYECMKLEEVRNDINKPQPKIKQINKSCPQCGGNLVERKGPYGKFKGCSNFPNCKYTESI